MMKRIVIAIIILALITTALFAAGVKIGTAADTGSMEPTITGGNVVIVAPAREYTAGDIVIFKPPEGSNIELRGYIAHRIVRITGENVITKGDSLDQADPWIVNYRDIRGRVVLVIGSNK